MNRIEATLTARAFLPLVSGLRELGHDPVPFLAAVNVDSRVLADPDARIPMSAGVDLLSRAGESTGHDCIGLHLAEHADFRSVDALFYAMVASNTLREAVNRLSRYQRLIHETSRIDVSETADGLSLRHILPGGFAAPRQTIAVRAFISFFTHYLMHMIPVFWRLHRVHHLDTELDVTTTVRFHPLEFFAQVLPAVPIVLAFGLTPWVLVFYELLDVAVTLWTHSNTRLPDALDRVLRYIVVTPDLHRIHHSAWKPETNSNYGAVFPWWDIVFGTFRAHPRDRHQDMRLGLDEVRGGAAQRPLWLLGSIFTDGLPAHEPDAAPLDNLDEGRHTPLI